jgi:hypothetical protein
MPEDDDLAASRRYLGFTSVSAERYAEENQAWKACGDLHEPPPLTPEQRESILPVLDFILSKAKWVREAKEAIRQGSREPLPDPPNTPHIAPHIMVHAQPGAGKSVTITALCKWVDSFSNAYAKVACTAFQGSAAILIPHGRTIATCSA